MRVICGFHKQNWYMARTGHRLRLEYQAENSLLPDQVLVAVYLPTLVHGWGLAVWEGSSDMPDFFLTQRIAKDPDVSNYAVKWLIPPTSVVSDVRSRGQCS
jgi:hypothetical protein